jgi:hypothetical protein
VDVAARALAACQTHHGDWAKALLAVLPSRHAAQARPHTTAAAASPTRHLNGSDQGDGAANDDDDDGEDEDDGGEDDGDEGEDANGGGEDDEASARGAVDAP